MILQANTQGDPHAQENDATKDSTGGAADSVEEDSDSPFENSDWHEYDIINGLKIIY